MNAIVCKTIVTWGDWMGRWNCQDLSLFERLGLLHHGYDVVIDPQNLKERAERFALYLGLSDSESSGIREIFHKARSVLVNKVMNGPENDDINLIIKGPQAQEVMSALTKFLCSTGPNGYGNWTFRTSGDHGSIQTSKWFMQLLRFILNNQSACSECVSTARDSMVLKAFLEAPSELWVMVSNLEPRLFTLADLKKLAAKVQGVGPEGFDHHTSSDLVSWAGRHQGRGVSSPGLKDLLKDRSIVSTLNHHDGLLLMAGLVRDQEEEAAKFIAVG